MEHITPNKVLGCVVYPAAIISQPGVIKHIEGKRFILENLMVVNRKEQILFQICLLNLV